MPRNGWKFESSFENVALKSRVLTKFSSGGQAHQRFKSSRGDADFYPLKVNLVYPDVCPSKLPSTLVRPSGSGGANSQTSTV